MNKIRMVSFVIIVRQIRSNKKLKWINKNKVLKISRIGRLTINPFIYNIKLINTTTHPATAILLWYFINI